MNITETKEVVSRNPLLTIESSGNNWLSVSSMYTDGSHKVWSADGVCKNLSKLIYVNPIFNEKYDMRTASLISDILLAEVGANDLCAMGQIILCSNPEDIAIIRVILGDDIANKAESLIENKVPTMYLEAENIILINPMSDTYLNVSKVTCKELMIKDIISHILVALYYQNRMYNPITINKAFDIDIILDDYEAAIRSIKYMESIVHSTVFLLENKEIAG